MRLSEREKLKLLYQKKKKLQRFYIVSYQNIASVQRYHKNPCEWQAKNILVHSALFFRERERETDESLGSAFVQRERERKFNIVKRKRKKKKTFIFMSYIYFLYFLRVSRCVLNIPRNTFAGRYGVWCSLGKGVDTCTVKIVPRMIYWSTFRLSYFVASY